MRLRLSTAGKIYCVCALLQNARTCLLVYMFTCFFQFTCFFFILQCIKEKQVYEYLPAFQLSLTYVPGNPKKAF